ncbi:hypothetical protein BDR26DRAFT_1006464 [Obelidium mucronatum]|nr:hypothetical protein BDR26DRAFT_1006464 [Obelidium mucronatum]
MKATIAALVLAAASVFACAPGEGGPTCITSGGSWLYMISPYAGATLAAGQPFEISWDVCGQDPTFLKSTISFEIADASIPTNVQSISAGQLTFAQPPVVSSLKTTATVPSGLTAGTKYTIKSSYSDALSNKWVFCFGNTFTVSGGTGSVANATVIATKKSGADRVSAAAAAAVAIAGALVL